MELKLRKVNRGGGSKPVIASLSGNFSIEKSLFNEDINPSTNNKPDCCHAEFISASCQQKDFDESVNVARSRNKFGMTENLSTVQPFNCSTQRKCAAFTLVEILITLGIIGVVAAMTLPTLIKNYQQKVMVEKLNSTYSTLYQSIKMSEIDNGPLETWELPEENAEYEVYKEFAKQYFTPYLKNIKECQTFTQCLGEKRYYIDGVEHQETERYAMILNNSAVVSFWGRSRSKTAIYIDINGAKGPNTFGKDIFAFILSNIPITSGNYHGRSDKPGLYFYGQGFTNNYLKSRYHACSKTEGTGSRGLFCGALIMQNGWKIPDDYPW